MQATDELRREHEGIAVMLLVLGAVSDKLKHAEQINADHLHGIIEFLSVFVDQCHHGKEEEFLFPALQAAGVERDGGPIGILLSEHEQGRKLVSQLRDIVRRYISGEKAVVAEFQSKMEEYVELLEGHIKKENNILFPMADAKLDPNEDMGLCEAFERLERERIGVGKHEAFHSFLSRLEREYLG